MSDKLQLVVRRDKLEFVGHWVYSMLGWLEAELSV